MSLKSSRAALVACLMLTLAAACSKKTASGPAASTPATPAAPVAAVAPGTPTQPDADRAAAKFPGTTLAQLQEGQALYTANCARCHRLFKPYEFNEEQWRHEVPPMAVKARVDATTEAKILAYVVTMSGAK